LFFQYYMPVDRTKAIELMHIVKEAEYKGLWITVDTPVLGPMSTWETGDDNACAPTIGG
jgi:L-lactate dehydrogenase (cytochrome)